MMDVVYILGNGSKWQNLELRYSLRSLEKYVRFNRVFIIGERPDFLNGEAVHVPNKAKHTNKARNIMENVLLACNDDRISDNFLFLNDDYFFTGNVEPEAYPFYYKCDLKQTVRMQGGEYRQHVSSTIKALEKLDLPTLNFDTHYPIRYNRAILKDVINLYDWNRPYGYVLKSLYCNSTGIQGEHRLDCKYYSPLKPEAWQRVSEGTEVFSIADACLNKYLRDWLKSSYPDKSRFEI